MQSQTVERSSWNLDMATRVRAHAGIDAISRTERDQTRHTNEQRNTLVFGDPGIQLESGTAARPYPSSTKTVHTPHTRTHTHTTHSSPFRSTQGGTCRRGCGGGAGHRRYRAHRDASCASRHARGPPKRAPASCGSSRNGTAAMVAGRGHFKARNHTRIAAAGKTTAVEWGGGERERGLDVVEQPAEESRLPVKERL